MAHAKSNPPNPDVFILPDLGEGVHEAELLKWRVKEGEVVEEHQILADMETDKAVVEVPSPRAGTIAKLHGGEGEVLHVGNPLVSYVGTGVAGKAPAGTASGGTTLQSRDPGASEAAAVNAAFQSESPRQRAREEAAAASRNGDHADHAPDAGTVVGAVGGSLGGISAAPGKALATPAVRRLARDLGVDIDALTGTGLAGRVTEKDVRAHTAQERRATPKSMALESRATKDRATTPTALESRTTKDRAGGDGALREGVTGDTQRIAFRGVRRTIANRLRESLSQTVHFTVMDEADVSALDVLRKRLAGASGEKVSFLPFVAGAVCRCLAGEFADFNSTTDDEAEEIVRHRAVHLGIATDTDAGLMVPVVRDCDKLGVLEIGRHIGHVAEAARNRTAPRDALMGSTFTISNVGSHAGRFATPILNYPEVGILAVGRARDGVVVRGGGIAVGKLLPLSLACDHRVVDGARAALMLARIVEMLQSPEGLMGPARG